MNELEERHLNKAWCLKKKKKKARYCDGKLTKVDVTTKNLYYK